MEETEQLIYSVINKDILSEISKSLLYFDLRNLKFAFPLLNLDREFYLNIIDETLEIISCYTQSANISRTFLNLVNSDYREYLIKERRLEKDNNIYIRVDPSFYARVINYTTIVAEVKLAKLFYIYKYYQDEQRSVYRYVVINQYQVYKLAFHQCYLTSGLENISQLDYLVDSEDLKFIIRDNTEKLCLNDIDRYRKLYPQKEFSSKDELVVDLDSIILIYGCLDEENKRLFEKSLKDYFKSMYTAEYTRIGQSILSLMMRIEEINNK